MMAYNDLPSAKKWALNGPILRVKSSRDTLYIVFDYVDEVKPTEITLLTTSEQDQSHTVCGHVALASLMPAAHPTASQSR